MDINNFNPTWIMVIIAGISILSAILVALINNFLTNRNEKKKRQHEKDTLIIKNTHELDVKKLELLQESKRQAINDFMEYIGRCIEYEDTHYNTIEKLHANYVKVLPYLSEDTAKIAHQLVLKEKLKNDNTIIKLAESIRTHDMPTI